MQSVALLPAWCSGCNAVPNGTGAPWVARREMTLKICIAALSIVVVPVVSWLILTVQSHSEELAERGSRQDRAVEDVEHARGERNEIARRVERLDERTQAIQRSLGTQDRKLDSILERLER